jgi:hypothetical protein
MTVQVLEHAVLAETRRVLQEALTVLGPDADPPGAHQQRIAAPHGDAVRLCGTLELAGRDAVAMRQMGDAAVPGHVQEDAAGGEAAHLSMPFRVAPSQLVT